MRRLAASGIIKLVEDHSRVLHQLPDFIEDASLAVASINAREQAKAA